MLLRRWQRLESLVTNITEVNPLNLVCAWYPHTDPIQKEHSSTIQPLTSAGVLFEVDPCLEGNVAYGKPDPPACYQLGQIYILKYFGGMDGSMDHQHAFRQDDIF